MDRRRMFSAGLMLLIGAGTIIKSFDYSMGTLGRMGPGYFPLLLGAALVATGLLVLIVPDAARAACTTEARESVRSHLRVHLRAWIAVTVGMLAFVAIGGAGGFVPGTFALVFLSALGDRKNSLRSCLWLAAGVTVAAVVIFHYGLHMQFPLFTWGA